MALSILGDIQLDGGLSTSSAYARLSADVNKTGDKVRTGVSYYVSQEAFNNGAGKIYLSEPISTIFDYNRQNDGADILDVAHNKVKAELEGFGYSVQIVEL